MSGRVEVTECEPVWNKGQNFFGVNRGSYESNAALFKVGGRIVVGGTSYFKIRLLIASRCRHCLLLSRALRVNDELLSLLERSSGLSREGGVRGGLIQTDSACLFVRFVCLGSERKARGGDGRDTPTL